MLAIHPGSGQDFVRPGTPDRTYAICVIFGMFLVVLQYTCVREIRRGIQVWKHCAFDSSALREQVIRGDVQWQLVVQEAALLFGE